MDAATTGFHDDHFVPNAARRRALAITVSFVCYASLLLALMVGSYLIG